MVAILCYYYNKSVINRQLGAHVTPLTLKNMSFNISFKKRNNNATRNVN